MFCQECITAKKKFRKGDRVVLSLDGCRQMPNMISGQSAGTVVGFGREYNCVRVLIHGEKRPTTYHSGFWERV